MTTNRNPDDIISEFSFDIHIDLPVSYMLTPEAAGFDMEQVYQRADEMAQEAAISCVADLMRDGLLAKTNGEKKIMKARYSNTVKDEHVNGLGLEVTVNFGLTDKGRGF